MTKCSCNHCSKNIEFETDRAGEQIACPHCGMDTILFVPGGMASRGNAPKSRISTGKRNRQLLLIGGIGLFVLVAGLVGWKLFKQLSLIPDLGFYLAGFFGAFVFIALYVFLFFLAVLWILFPFVVWRGMNRLEKVLLEIKHKLPPNQ